MPEQPLKNLLRVLQSRIRSKGRGGVGWDDNYAGRGGTPHGALMMYVSQEKSNDR